MMCNVQWKYNILYGEAWTSFLSLTGVGFLGIQNTYYRFSPTLIKPFFIMFILVMLVLIVTPAYNCQEWKLFQTHCPFNLMRGGSEQILKVGQRSECSLKCLLSYKCDCFMFTQHGTDGTPSCWHFINTATEGPHEAFGNVFCLKGMYVKL